VTPQEIFDTVATHLFTQGHRAYDNNLEQCAYKTPDGSMCAVGCLIQDYYKPEMDSNAYGSDIQTVYGVFKNDLPNWVKDSLGLLTSLQDVHDADCSWNSVDTLKAALKEVALKCNLDYSVLNKFERFGS
jgi:hypothetical protein